MAVLSRRLVADAIAEKLLAGEPRQKVMRSLASYLIEHRRVSQADRYISDIERALAQKQFVVADITTAHPLDESMRKAITDVINASHVQLRERVDTDVIGGIIIKTPTHELDATVRTTLRRLRTT